jgi:L-lactate dehydrogenase complex protein LldF
MLGSPVREILHCIRCGACMNHCPVYGTIGGHAYDAVYPGPLGAALDPGLDGIKKTYDLPSASSFCGRCETVCPVKIPLTRIMRYWRGVSFEQGLPSPWFNRGVQLWAFAAKRPALYRSATAIAVRALRFFAGSRPRIKSLPIMGGWFAARDLPKPARQSFQNQWRKGKRP